MSRSGSPRGHHEAFIHQNPAKGGSNRGFGLTVGGILLAIGVYRAFNSGSLNLGPVALMVVGGALVILGLLLPASLTPLNLAWTRLGLLMSKVANPVVMALIFLTTVVPIGLAMRLAGKDPLRLKSDPEAESYWIERVPPGPAPETIKNQF